MMALVETAYAKGKMFERISFRLFSAIGMNISMTGGPSDGGIDFEGRWELPDQQVRVVGQCKNESRQCGVRHLREFEGVLACHSNALGVFASRLGYTRQAIRQANISNFPIILTSIDPNRTTFEFFKLNKPARALIPELTAGTTFSHDNQGNRSKDTILLYGKERLQSEDSLLETEDLSF